MPVQNKPFTALVLVLALSVTLSACVSVEADKAAMVADVPAHWSVETAALENAADLTRWWEGFNDPVLDSLITDALAANPDFLSAQARVREARAVSRATGAALGPSFDAGAGANQTRTGGLGNSSTSSNASLDASWELDLFGQTQAELKAARESARATREDLHDAQVSLSAEVALSYFDWRSTSERLVLARENVVAQKQTLEIVEWRGQAGLASSLDLAQARTDLATVEAGLPALETAIAAARNRLSVLTGRVPGAVEQTDAPLPVLNTAIAADIPAVVLERRPDVRATAHRLEAQVANLNAAKRERFPSIRLSGSIGLSALGLSALTGGGSAIATLASALTAPIFQSGRIAASIAAEDARLDQALNAYRGAVLSALEDVENGLVNLSNAKVRSDKLATALVSGREAAALAEQRYQSGLIDFLAVLDARRTLRNLQDQAAQARADIAVAQAQLFKALGGGYGPATQGQSDDI